MLTHWVNYVDPFGKKKCQLFFFPNGPIILFSDLSRHTLTFHFLGKDHLDGKDRQAHSCTQALPIRLYGDP
jgi:hypothetical protein